MKTISKKKDDSQNIMDIVEKMQISKHQKMTTEKDSQKKSLLAHDVKLLQSVMINIQNYMVRK